MNKEKVAFFAPSFSYLQLLDPLPASSVCLHQSLAGAQQHLVAGRPRLHSSYLEPDDDSLSSRLPLLSQVLLDVFPVLSVSEVGVFPVKISSLLLSPPLLQLFAKYNPARCSARNDIPKNGPLDMCC